MGPGPILEAPGDLPDQISVDFGILFCSFRASSCRGLLGSAGVLPGSTSNLSNPLFGVPLGYGDLAQRFKFAVPHRGAGVSNPVRSPTGPGGVSPPYLPAGPGETVEPLAQKGPWRPFSDFFRFFRCSKKRCKIWSENIHLLGSTFKRILDDFLKKNGCMLEQNSFQNQCQLRNAIY